MKFAFECVIKHLPPYSEPKPIETFKGTVEAESHDEAEKSAQSLVFARCRQLEQTYGGMYGFDSNTGSVNLVPDAPVTTMTASQIVDLIKAHLDKAKTNTERAIQIDQSTRGRGKRLTRSAVDSCSGQHMALTMLLNEIELNLEPPPAIVQKPAEP